MRNVLFTLLFTLLFAGLFLLLLSALVVSVSPEGLEPLPSAPANAVLVPQPVQAYEANGLSAMRPLSSYPLWLYAVLSITAMQTAVCLRLSVMKTASIRYSAPRLRAAEASRPSSNLRSQKFIYGRMVDTI